MYPSGDGQDVIGNGDQRDRPGGLLPWRPGWAGRNASVVVGLALAVGLIAGYLGGPPAASGNAAAGRRGP
jgi:hypothetical protein